jgi:hypothetical protein
MRPGLPVRAACKWSAVARHDRTIDPTEGDPGTDMTTASAAGGAVCQEVYEHQGKMLSMLTTMRIPDSDDTLDLAPTDDGFGYVARITRCRKDGSVIWTAFPPGGERQDSWAAVRLEGPRVIANSWSCYLVHLDLETGDEIARTFTK